MRNMNDAVAVVTGAGSGIGRALALQFAGQGARLALADVNEQGLQETQHLLTGRTESRRYVLDVACASAVENFARQVESDFGRASILVNNAGVTLIGDFRDVSVDEIEWLMNINFWGVVHGCKFFLPLLRREPDAHIVNMSSISGLLGLGGQTHYCASKFAVRGFTEALRQELLNTSVKVTTVYPGGIRTPIVRNARIAASANPVQAAAVQKLFSKLNLLSPDHAAQLVINSVLHDKSRLLIGPDARSIDTLQRLLPSRANAIIRAMIRRL
jgi:NAD(P)-dependent dehydrogenase (short-subunit alcohol dehydrogenase family)